MKLPRLDPSPRKSACRVGASVFLMTLPWAMSISPYRDLNTIFSGLEGDDMCKIPGSGNCSSSNNSKSKITVSTF